MQWCGWLSNIVHIIKRGMWDMCTHKYLWIHKKRSSSAGKTKAETGNIFITHTNTWGDLDVGRLFGSTAVGDAGTLPLESNISRVRRSLAGFSHFVTRNLRTIEGFECLCSLRSKWESWSRSQGWLKPLFLSSWHDNDYIYTVECMKNHIFTWK